MPLKKCPAGEKWANKENWIYWLSAQREGSGLCLFLEESNNQQKEGKRMEWRRTVGFKGEVCNSVL